MWSCPDLGEPRDAPPMSVPGCSFEWQECPAYYLRTPGDDLPAVHLVDGAIHPAHMISQSAVEMESGATPTSRMAPKVVELAHLYLRERSERDKAERERRKRGSR